MESTQMVMSPNIHALPYAEKVHATNLINNPLEGKKAASLKAEVLGKAKQLQSSSSSPQKLKKIQSKFSGS